MNIEKRNIATCIILSLVTCGIYQIYWVIKIAKEAVSVKDPQDNALAEMLLMIFIPFVGCYLAEKKFYEGATNMGVQVSDNSVLYLVLGLFGLGIVNIALIQNDLNKVADFVPPQATGFYDASSFGADNGFNQNNGFNNGNNFNADNGFNNDNNQF